MGAGGVVLLVRLSHLDSLGQLDLTIKLVKMSQDILMQGPRLIRMEVVSENLKDTAWWTHWHQQIGRTSRVGKEQCSY